MYEEMAKLNELMNFVVVIAAAMIGAAVRTSMALRDRTKIINKSWVVFVTDQIMGVASGFIAYAIIVQWFVGYNYLVKLVAIGCASGPNARRARPGFSGRLKRAWRAGVAAGRGRACGCDRTARYIDMATS